MTNPQRIDFHQRDAPRPIELKGNRSPRRIIMSRATALIQSSVSFTIAELVVRVGAKYKIVCRITRNANSDKNRPIQVARETFAGGAALSDIMGVTEMPQISSLDSRIFPTNRSCGSQKSGVRGRIRITLRDRLRDSRETADIDRTHARCPNASGASAEPI